MDYGSYYVTNIILPLLMWLFWYSYLLTTFVCLPVEEVMTSEPSAMDVNKSKKGILKMTHAKMSDNFLCFFVYYSTNMAHNISYLFMIHCNHCIVRQMDSSFRVS